MTKIEKIRKLATKVKSQAEVARRASISKAYLSYVLHGHREPTPAMQDRILDAFASLEDDQWRS